MWPLPGCCSTLFTWIVWKSTAHWLILFSVTPQTRGGVDREILRCFPFNKDLNGKYLGASARWSELGEEETDASNHSVCCKGCMALMNFGSEGQKRKHSMQNWHDFSYYGMPHESKPQQRHMCTSLVHQYDTCQVWTSKRSQLPLGNFPSRYHHSVIPVFCHFT